jgi:hypothetical protein
MQPTLSRLLHRVAVAPDKAEEYDNERHRRANEIAWARGGDDWIRSRPPVSDQVTSGDSWRLGAIDGYTRSRRTAEQAAGGLRGASGTKTTHRQGEDGDDR